MNYRSWYSSSRKHNWDYNYHQDRRDRAWPQFRQEDMTSQGNSSSSLAGNTDQQNINRVQPSLRSVIVHPHGNRAFPYHTNQRGNSHHQSSFTSYNQHGNNYPMHQRNEPLTTTQGNRSNIINQANLSYVRLQESSSSSKAQGNSQTRTPPKNPLRKRQQQQNNTKVLMTTPPFLEVIAPLKEVLLFPTGNDLFELQIQEHVLKHFKPWTDNSYQVVVRFCRYIPGSNQKDYYPSCLQLRVNGLLCHLPVKTSEKLMMFVQVTRRLTHEDLLQKLVAKSSIPPTVTVAKIKEKLQEDTSDGSDITMTSLHFALLCPLSKTRMTLPCRASTCKHLQCFDAAFYLKMNEKKPKWICPVCADPVEYENLQIDEHFKNILEENISSDKILLQADGSWKPFQPQDSSENILTLDDTLDCSSHAANVAGNFTADNISKAHHTTIDLLSEDEASALDDEDDNSALSVTDSAPSTSGENGKSVEVVVLSDDDSFGSPPRSRSRRQKSVGHQVTSTPSTSLSLKISTEGESKTPTLRRSKRKTSQGTRKKSPLNKSIDRPPLRMTLRSHSRMMKLENLHKT
ncbi:uncharacterized protein LOC127001484 isoform X2 [Eriocheir sinensis]|uniref:uncharacterized protein LOC127001484 isoform X2 n=1 Tax=Eriocheir sinensis TaxID=95602 RepID=UPI0021C8E738|nr:uncharacterized protein LOC127001484 isoform X2 [Eriocheir sinensis]